MVGVAGVAVTVARRHRRRHQHRRRGAGADGRAAALLLAASDPARHAAAARVGGLRHARGDRRRLAPLLRPARLVADRDQQGAHVFAVLSALRVCGARAAALDAVGRELDADGVRLAVVAAHRPARGHVGRGHVVDDSPSEVLEPAEEGAGAEEAAEAAVAQGREGVGDRRHVEDHLRGCRALWARGGKTFGLLGRSGAFDVDGRVEVPWRALPLPWNPSPERIRCATQVDGVSLDPCERASSSKLEHTHLAAPSPCREPCRRRDGAVTRTCLRGSCPSRYRTMGTLWPIRRRTARK